ncbi:MAG: site-specific integrase [Phycisphaerales bacterium]|nr:site-specific integrase [Phycisphaerales bacterium]
MKADKKRRALSPAEIRDLLDAAPPERAICYLLLVYTGLRRAEAGQLKWAHLHLDGLNAHIELPPTITKSGHAEAVRLVPELAAALRDHRGNASDRDPVFAAIPSMPDFRDDLADAGIEEVDARGRKVVLHSLRHSLATMLAASGVPMPVAQRIMRHRDIKLTAEVYTDEGLLPLHAAMQALPSLGGATVAHGPKAAREA